MKYYYYKVPEFNVYGGEHLLTLSNKKIYDFLNNNNIKLVLNLAKEHYQLENGIKVESVYINEVPFYKQVDKCIQIIDNSLGKNNSILVHCDRGIDRTGCVIGSYLCSSGMQFEKVKTFLLSCFPEYRRSKKYIELHEPYFEIIKEYDKAIY